MNESEKVPALCVVSWETKQGLRKQKITAVNRLHNWAWVIGKTFCIYVECRGLAGHCFPRWFYQLHSKWKGEGETPNPWFFLPRTALLEFLLFTCRMLSGCCVDLYCTTINETEHVSNFTDLCKLVKHLHKCTKVEATYMPISSRGWDRPGQSQEPGTWSMFLM